MKCEAVGEMEMRAAKVPWPETPEELAEYIQSLVERQHDYGTCVYAMSMAATAAFQYVAHVIGVSGFQASMADMDVLRRTRNIDGPFMIVDFNKALYPQYDILSNVGGELYKPEMRKWLKEQAEKKLAESPDAHPDVIAHWQRLAA